MVPLWRWLVALPGFLTTSSVSVIVIVMWLVPAAPSLLILGSVHAIIAHCVQWRPDCKMWIHIITMHTGMYWHHSFWNWGLLSSSAEVSGFLKCEPNTNTLPSGHVERCYCSPMHCWHVTSFCVFLHDILHMHLSAGLAHLSLQGYWQLDAGFLGLKLQTNRPFLTPYF